jgi:hypothetical protein
VAKLRGRPIKSSGRPKEVEATPNGEAHEQTETTLLSTAGFDEQDADEASDIIESIEAEQLDKAIEEKVIKNKQLDKAIEEKVIKNQQLDKAIEEKVIKNQQLDKAIEEKVIKNKQLDKAIEEKVIKNKQLDKAIEEKGIKNKQLDKAIEEKIIKNQQLDKAIEEKVIKNKQLDKAIEEKIIKNKQLEKETALATARSSATSERLGAQPFNLSDKCGFCGIIGFVYRDDTGVTCHKCGRGWMAGLEPQY